MNKLKIAITFLFIFAGAYGVFSIDESYNIALKNQVIGTVINAKVLTDGIIDSGNYAEIKKKDKEEQFFIIALGGAKYIKSIKLYWVKGFEPASYKIDMSQSLFTWEGSEIYNYKADSEKNKLEITEHQLKNRAAFFVRLSILKSKGPSVRISEVELFADPAVRAKINNQQVKAVMEYSVDIMVDTSLPTSAYLRFGDQEHNMSQNVGMEVDILNNHNIHVAGLLRGTTYYFQPVVRDLNGNLIMGSVQSFKTKGVPLPKCLSIQAVKTKAFSTELEWGLNVPCMSELLIGTSPVDLKSCFKNDKFDNECRVVIDKLVPETKFYYKIISTDNLNNKAEIFGNFITSENNIALNKKAYGTFLNYPDSAGVFDLKLSSRITDGNYELSGHVSSGHIASSAQVAIIDLGEKYKIRNVNVIWRSIAYSRNFEVSIGQDLKDINSWELIRSNIDTKAEGKGISSGINQGLMLRRVSVDVNGKEARFVKINVPIGALIGSDLPFHPGPFLQLTEIEVFKVSDYAPPEYIVKKIN